MSICPSDLGQGSKFSLIRYLKLFSEHPKDFCFKPVIDEISFNQDTHEEEQPSLSTSPSLSSQEHIPQLDGLHSSVHEEEKCSTCELYFYNQEELSNYMKENSIASICDGCHDLFTSQWEMDKMYPPT